MTRAGALLVRPRAWWFNKVPLSFTLVLLLLDGRRFSLAAVAVLVLIVLTVCAVGNYGYALNELFDIEEDARAQRVNAAATAGVPRMWTIAALSAVVAGLCATAAAGVPGGLLTVLELCLPLAYSVPPVRLKERTWLGAAADGLAAHVYPALLALLAVAHWGLRPVPVVLAVAVAVWSAAAGLRGILLHQLYTAERDRTAGLTTVAHDIGTRRLERVITGLLPFECGAFAVAVVACGVGPVACVLLALYALYVLFEAYETASGRFRTPAFRPEGRPHLPIIVDGFYKAWGPLVLALDTARVDIAWLLVIPVYALCFRPHLSGELNRLRLAVQTLRFRRATAPSARSNGGS